eukprot:NODE_963_length_2727_cov_0.218798.p1 type:complete len:427 gc:universal NODE_963_length_2727_cov_0.218798:622-1902(+)
MHIDTSKKRLSSGSFIIEEGGASVNKTLFLLIKSFLGTGIIFLPKAFYVAGLIPSILMLILSAGVSLWGLLLLSASAAVIPGSYQDIAHAIYGSKFKALVLSSIAIAQFCFAMIYILFVATNLKDLISTLSNCSYQMNDFFPLVMAQLIIYIPLVLIRQMKNFANVALVGNIAIFLSIIYVLWNDIKHASERPLEWKMTSSLSSIVLFYGIAISAFEGIGLVVPVRQAMANPDRFAWCLKICMIFLTVMYLIVGGTSALVFGKHTETIILLNMPNGMILQILQIGYVFAILVSVPLQLFPAFEILEEPLFPDPQLGNKISKSVEMQRSLFRIALVVVVCLVAYMFSDILDLFVSLVGVFVCIPISFIYPPLLYLKACANTKSQKISSVLLIVFALISMAVCTFITVQKIISGQTDEALDRCMANKL